jgi:hypothetical protein
LVLSGRNNYWCLRYRCMERVQICISKPKKIEEKSICNFADQLAFDLINNNFDDGGSSTTITIISPLMDSPQRRLARKESLVVEVTEASISLLTESTSSKIQYDLMRAKMMELHQPMQQDTTESTGRKIRHYCAFCKLKAGWLCKTCKVYCCPEIKGGKQPRNCYKEHMLQAHPSF